MDRFGFLLLRTLRLMIGTTLIKFSMVDMFLLISLALSSFQLPMANALGREGEECGISFGI